MIGDNGIYLRNRRVKVIKNEIKGIMMWERMWSLDWFRVVYIKKVVVEMERNRFKRYLRDLENIYVSKGK